MNIRTVLALAIAALGLAGCATSGSTNCWPFCTTKHVDSSSSLVAFLYPQGSAPPRDNTIPELRVPLRVGLGFLPSDNPYASGDGPTAAEKERLLEHIREHFARRKFVGEIIEIPDYYFAHGKGFSGLQSIQRLYDIDILALVSYDQMTASDNLKYRSLAYLTIVGAFVVNGSEHEVTTLVDLAVVDPKTRSLILRAGGTDTHHGVSTAIDAAKSTRASSDLSFQAATDAMIEHLDTELTAFEAKVRAGTAPVALVNRDGTPRGGGGASDLFGLLLLALLVLRRAEKRSMPR